MPPKEVDSEKDNLVVYTNGKIYSLPVDVYSNEKYRIQDSDHARGIPVWNALEKGVVVAKLRGLGVGVGGFCTLLNLPALTPPVVHPPTELAAQFKRERLESLEFIKSLAAEDLDEGNGGLESLVAPRRKPIKPTSKKPAPKKPTPKK
jgi:hypothetical protein